MGAKGGLIFEGKCIFENKPPPQSRSCLLLKKDLGAYFREDMVFKLAMHYLNMNYEVIFDFLNKYNHITPKSYHL